MSTALEILTVTTAVLGAIGIIVQLGREKSLKNDLVFCVFSKHSVEALNGVRGVDQSANFR